jgi:hypothetical protein
MTSVKAPYGDATRAVAHGSGVKFRSDTTAVVVRGRRVNHALRAVLKERQSTRSSAIKWIAAGVLVLSIIAAVATISNLSKEDAKFGVSTTNASSTGGGTSGVPNVRSQGFQPSALVQSSTWLTSMCLAPRLTAPTVSRSTNPTAPV